MAREWETPEYRRVAGETGAQRVSRINQETAANGLNRAVLVAPSMAALPARAAITDNMTGFQRDRAASQNATLDAIQRSRDIAALRSQISTGGLFGYFTDTPQAIAADAPKRAALEALLSPKVAATAASAATTRKAAQPQAVKPAATQTAKAASPLPAAVVNDPRAQFTEILGKMLANNKQLPIQTLMGVGSALPAPVKQRSATDIFGDRLAYLQDVSFKKEIADAQKLADPVARADAEQSAYEKYLAGNQAAYMKQAAFEAVLAANQPDRE